MVSKIRERIACAKEWNKDTLCFILAAVVIFSILCIETNNVINIQSDVIEPSVTIEPESASIIEQEIMLKNKRDLKAINLLFGTYAKENQGVVKLFLVENEQIIESWKIDSSVLPDNSYSCFKIDKEIRAKQDATYKIVVSEYYSGNNKVALYANDSVGNGYSVGGVEKKTGSICYRLDYDSWPLKTALIIAGAVFGVLAVILILLKKNEIMIMSGIILILLIAYMAICPIGSAPDEEGHFFRAFEIANGYLVSKHTSNDGEGGNFLPAELMNYDDPRAVVDWNDTKELVFGNTSLYAPVSYAPQALGIAITQMFTNKVSVIFYGGRCMNALCCLIICLLALQLVPFGRRLLFIIITMPMTLHEMVALAPDGFTISLCLLFLTYILYLSYSKARISYKDLAVLFVLGVTISLCKIVYIVLLILLFMLPERKFETNKRGLYYKIGIIIIAGTLNLIWLRLSVTYLVEFRPGVNSAEQCKFIITHIGEYYSIVVRTIIENAISYLSTMVGSSLGKLDVPITPIIWVVVVLLLYYEMLTLHENSLSVNKNDPLILFVSFISGVALIFTSLYVQWTAVRADTIQGIQGRYFIPIIALIGFSVILHRQKKLEKRGIKYVLSDGASYSILIMLLVNSFSLIDLIQHYYCE